MALLPWLSLAVAQPVPKVTLFVPDPPGSSPFWEQTIKIMHAAAEDLNVDLTVVYSHSNSYSLKKDGLKALNDPDKVDFFLTGYWTSSTQFHLQRAERLGIRSFIFNSGVAPGERAEMGRPRGKYKYWIGQVTPDDLQASYFLADILVNKAKAAGKAVDGKVHMIALGGWGSKNKIEEDRHDGLRKRIKEQNDAMLDEYILTGWSKETAYNELIEKLKKHQNVSAIWSAGGPMALGAVKAAENLGMVPGKDIFIGGFDWGLDGIQAIIDGKMVVTLGSHFLEGVKALILIHDYHYGIDFADDPGVETLSQLQPITEDNAKAYLDILQKLDWREIDFKRFSKKHNTKLETYDLSLDALLASMEQNS
jgi:ABC-type sugar transport system substrate-binding protein